MSMTIIDFDEFVERARAFLRQCEVELDEIDADTDLIASGVLDSLLILDFFFFLEELRGSELNPERASVDALATIRKAYELLHG